MFLALYRTMDDLKASHQAVARLTPTPAALQWINSQPALQYKETIDDHEIWQPVRRTR